MKITARKILLVLTILVLSAAALFASDDDGVWWDGMNMTTFRYKGLMNVSERSVDSLLSPYLGQPFSDAVFSEIISTLYAEPWLNYVSAEALREGDDGHLVIELTFSENPMVSSVTVEGERRIGENPLLRSQSIAKNVFFTPSMLSVNADAIRSYYLERGYRDATVTASYSEDESTNTVSVLFTVSEGKQYKVRDILFSGISGLTAKDLTGVMTQKKRSFFNAGNLIMTNIEPDKSAIIALYGAKGYPDASVVSVDVVSTGEEDENVIYVNLEYTISEGDRWTIGTVAFSGNEVFSNESIASLINVDTGDAYNAEDIAAMQNAISSLYYDNGYIRSQVIFTPLRDESTHTISYDIQISEGEQSVVEDIIITGLTKTRPYVLEREITLHVGDVFSRSALIRSQQNMMNTGLLSTVRADLLYGETENGVIIEFTVEEGNQMELQFGATFGGTVDGFPISGFLQWANRNLAGTGRDLAISTTLSPDTQSVSLSLSDDWVGDRRWANSISLSFERSYRDNTLMKNPNSEMFDGRDENKETFPLGYNSADEWYATDNPLYPSDAYLMAYDYYRIALGYTTGYTFAFDPGSLTLSAGISIGINHAVFDDSMYTPYEELIWKYHQDWQWSNRLTLSVTWDGRDLRQNTTRGYVLSASYTYAGGILMGLSNYNRLSLSGSVYHSLFTYRDEEERPYSLVLSYTGSVSFMFDQFWGKDGKWGWYNAKEGATRYEMLYIDGMNIGRGFDVIYDKAFLWHNQIDLTYPIVYQMVAVEGFASATGVTDDISDLSSFWNIDWYFAAGVGLKMQIPGFPLGLYLVENWTWDQHRGFRWDSTGIGNSGLKLVLAITTSYY
ncbi:MAG: outer membrane protein assembly factor BamA [Spirochaetes bacterium]|uniref:Outer membrane protein assembly factor BamA n=1 Tax=Candidatus Ornithospirochaeta stercoripullorum TaxID=2840899 RepID=A0A9D9E1E9_9SPIO|nr:outer membrane protein assembly factor BamA [Candidatus Ornithospirochaeta stercoripullorum]